MPNNTNSDNQIDMQRYTKTAVILHWVIGLAIIGMIASGFAMKNLDLEQSMKFAMYDIHKSMGLLVLAAVALRVLWRIFNRPPAFPTEINKRDAILAKLGHLALYIMMIMMPVSGWILVSTHAGAPFTSVFGLFNWPDLPNMSGNSDLHHQAEEIHEFVVWPLMLVIVLHALAVVKHIMVDKVNLMPRMAMACPCKKKEASPADQ